MQTFLPYEDFYQSAQCLDRLRLGKQRVEVKQILIALFDPTYGWGKHPAVLMWKGHEKFLVQYGLAICTIWIERGYKDRCKPQIKTLGKLFRKSTPPPWLGLEKFHLSHRSNLVRKDPTHYGKLWPTVKPDLPYWWPTKEIP